jgi:hypothetical protein
MTERRKPQQFPRRCRDVHIVGETVIFGLNQAPDALGGELCEDRPTVVTTTFAGRPALVRGCG